jgi:DNA-binding transcriptional LysR family regulator
MRIEFMGLLHARSDDRVGTHHHNGLLNCIPIRLSLSLQFLNLLYAHKVFHMPRRIDWERQIGRRLKLRDLHVFFTVVQCGTMAKAALQLGVSQPAVSEVIADLENALGVRLLDRRSQGVDPTVYGNALRKRCVAVFDELKQGIRDIEFLADSTVGELRIGCGESISAAVLPPIIQRFARQFPGVVLDVHDDVTTPTFPPKLHDRSIDLAVVRGGSAFAAGQYDDDFNVEILFDDELVIAVGQQSRWARRRKIDLTELADESWILTAPDATNYKAVAEAFRECGVAAPKVTLKTISVLLRTHLLTTGAFVTVFPKSVLRIYGNRLGLKILPIDMPKRHWPVILVTLKNRTLSPVVERFVECAREVAKAIAGSSRRNTTHRRKPGVA